MDVESRLSDKQHDTVDSDSPLKAFIKLDFAAVLNVGNFFFFFFVYQ